MKRKLIVDLDDAAIGVRYDAVSTLRLMTTKVSSKVVPALIAVLSDESSEPELRWTAALAIGNLAEGNEVAVAAIEKQLSDPAVGVLISVLEDRNNENCHAAASVLGEVGPPANSALPVPREALHDPDLGVSLSSAHMPSGPLMVTRLVL